MSESMSNYLKRLKGLVASGNLPLQLYHRAADNPTSLAYAVHARCVQCAHGTDEEGWVEAIRDCKASRCALLPIRPYQESDGNRVSRRKAINAYCWKCMGGRDDGRSGANGNIRRLIHECSIETCFIHAVRPYRDWNTSGTDEDSVTGA